MNARKTDPSRTLSPTARRAAARAAKAPGAAKARAAKAAGAAASATSKTARVIEASDATFDTVVGKAPGAVLLDLWAPWCGPCRVLGPILAEVAQRYAGRVTVVKINVDESPATAEKFDVSAIPTLVLITNGRRSVQVGALPRKAIETWLDRELRGAPTSGDRDAGSSA